MPEKNFKLAVSLTAAAAVCIMTVSGCYDGSSADWEDTLPVAATEASRPTVVYITEDTSESTEPITFPMSESTKRTASSESNPELATTTSADSGDDVSEPEVSAVPGVPKVPISEFTSTTPINFAELASSASSASAASENPPAAQTAQTAQTAEASAVSTGVPSGPDTNTRPSSDTSGDVSETTGLLSALGSSESSVLDRPYSYRFLDEKHTYIYNEIINAAENYSSSITFDGNIGISSEDYCDVYQIIYDDEPSMFFIDKKMQYAVNSSTKKLASSKMFYKYGKDATEKMQSEIDAEVDRILAMITSDMTDYDKVKLFNDVLASTVVYDDTADNCRDIYGVFVDKKAICGGFSKAFSYLCSKAGVETATVTGDADGQPHMWNKVRIDGKWYNIDITYAVSSGAEGNYVRYDYFCVPDKMLEESRTVYDQPYKYPEAVSNDCSYFAKNNLIAESWTEARIMLRDGLIESSADKTSPVQIQCSDREVYDETVFNLFDSSSKQALDIYEEAYKSADNKFNSSVVNFSYDATSLVIKLFPEYE
ncbi:MAG: hypothetical protein NC395_04830 [Prevotella sp.]|nr:hypothetical protein [Prevotella sp.]